MIFCCEPEFDDWFPIIQNLNIPIINNITQTIILNPNTIIIPLKFSQIKLITSILNLDNYPKVLCPKNYDTIDILNNKINFYYFMINNNFENLIPITYKINNEIIQQISYPCIFKLAITFGGKDSTICKNPRDLKQCEKNKNDYFIQEFIMGSSERSAHLFIRNGIIKWAKCYELKHHNNFYIHKGRMEKYKKISDFDFNLFKDIFMRLDYTGFACIDFKIINGNIKIFEINPRLGGTLVHDEDFKELITYINENV